MERGFMPMNVIHCAACNKSCDAKEALIVPDMFSLAKKQLKDVADIFCDRWNPKTAFIYDNFAVLEFWSKDQFDTMCTYIDAHELMFEGLDFLTDEKTHILITKSPDIVVAG
jgi:hypothetical protein